MVSDQGAEAWGAAAVEAAGQAEDGLRSGQGPARGVLHAPDYEEAPEEAPLLDVHRALDVAENPGTTQLCTLCGCAQELTPIGGPSVPSTLRTCGRRSQRTCGRMRDLTRGRRSRPG
ncbi:DUF6233 domain-containing protein [Streptomyces sp. I5]|uniref:DUF6233 domain-containing protein n=1 Tax=Streptomyces sp. I5 TaxID=2759947 RepID=UPI0035A99B9B